VHQIEGRWFELDSFDIFDSRKFRPGRFDGSLIRESWRNRRKQQSGDHENNHGSRGRRGKKIITRCHI